MKIGSHVSNNGSLMLAGSLAEALSYNATSFMVYLGPPQSTQRKPYSSMNSDLLLSGLKDNSIDINDVIVHAPYIINLAQGDDEKRDYAINFLSNEMKMMSLIGLKYIVVHPGAHMKQGIEKGIELISDSINKVLNNTKNLNNYSKSPCICIETMAGKGTECCFEFSQIKKIFDLVHEKDRLFVCFDTCHTHDAGYDLINDYQGVMKEFDDLIGIDKIKVIHLNDSKNPRGAKKDRHENIGFGYIGFDSLMQFVNDERFKSVPKILETPYVKGDNQEYSPYKYEIEMIKANKFNENLLADILINNQSR